MTNLLSVYISSYVKYCEAVCVSPPWSERNVSLCFPLSFNNNNPFLYEFKLFCLISMESLIDMILKESCFLSNPGASLL